MASALAGIIAASINRIVSSSTHSLRMFSHPVDNPENDNSRLWVYYSIQPTVVFSTFQQPLVVKSPVYSTAFCNRIQPARSGGLGAAPPDWPAPRRPRPLASLANPAGAHARCRYPDVILIGPARPRPGPPRARCCARLPSLSRTFRGGPQRATWRAPRPPGAPAPDPSPPLAARRQGAAPSLRRHAPSLHRWRAGRRCAPPSIQSRPRWGRAGRAPAVAHRPSLCKAAAGCAGGLRPALQSLARRAGRSVGARGGPGPVTGLGPARPSARHRWPAARCAAGHRLRRSSPPALRFAPSRAGGCGACRGR